MASGLAETCSWLGPLMRGVSPIRMHGFATLSGTTTFIDPRTGARWSSGAILAPPGPRLRRILHLDLREPLPSRHSGEQGTMTRVDHAPGFRLARWHGR